MEVLLRLVGRRLVEIAALTIVIGPLLVVLQVFLVHLDLAVGKEVVFSLNLSKA